MVRGVHEVLGTQGTHWGLSQAQGAVQGSWTLPPGDPATSSQTPILRHDPPQLPYAAGWTHSPLPVRPRVTQPVRRHGCPALGGEMLM